MRSFFSASHPRICSGTFSTASTPCVTGGAKRSPVDADVGNTAISAVTLNNVVNKNTFAYFLHQGVRDTLYRLNPVSLFCPRATMPSTAHPTNTISITNSTAPVPAIIEGFSFNC